MSQATSLSPSICYGLARVCRAWGVARSTLYWHRQKPRVAGRRPGLLGPCTDEELVGQIWAVLQALPFHGEGYRKVWARLRYAGVHTSPPRVLRLMREQGVLAPQR
jgi:putative transposase